jgi:lysophospholipase L1-like esterase
MTTWIAATSTFAYVLLLASCPPGRPPAPDLTAPGGVGIHAIDASIAKRFGSDRNNNGVIDMPIDYGQTPLRVTINAKRLAQSFPSQWPYENQQGAGFNNTQGSWRWTFSERQTGSVPQGLQSLPLPASGISGLSATNDGQTIVTFSTGPGVTVNLYEGEWAVELARIDGAGNPIYWKTVGKTLEDALIVQLGDSFSSGEGAPDRGASEGYWGDDGNGANGSYANAHASSKTWGSLVAQDLTSLRGLFGSSVTFLNLAESGAVINDVVNQLGRLRALVGPRKVDMVLLSIGGNDAGLANAIAAYMVREPVLFGGGLLGPTQAEIANSIRTGNWTGGAFTDAGSVLVELFDWTPQLRDKFRNVRGVSGLPAGYQHLDSQFRAHNIDPANVYILQYPDPLAPDRANPSQACSGPILTAMSAGLGRQLEIGPAEQRHAKQHLIVPLNQEVSAAATRYGWNAIPAESAMYGHAICQDDRMVNLFRQSMDRQGDNRGTLHPNANGYRAMADVAFRSLR